MTLTHKIKVLDDKIRENEAQFILDWGPAWIWGFRLETIVVKQATFEYSP